MNDDKTIGTMYKVYSSDNKTRTMQISINTGNVIGYLMTTNPEEINCISEFFDDPSEIAIKNITKRISLLAADLQETFKDAFTEEMQDFQENHDPLGINK